MSQVQGTPSEVDFAFGDQARAKSQIMPALEVYRNQTSPGPVSILIHGLPGTGKTHLVKWIEHQLNLESVTIHSGDLVPERNPVYALGNKLNQVRAQAPVIALFDEIDYITWPRDVMDSPEGHNLDLEVVIMRFFDEHNRVFVVATTNAPWLIDDAIIRRFDYPIYLTRPNVEERGQVLVSILGNELSEEDIARIARRTPEFGPADLKKLVDRARMMSQMQGMGGRVTSADLLAALTAKPWGRLTDSKISNYETKCQALIQAVHS